MTAPATVGVSFPEATARRHWIRLLADLLYPVQVVDAEETEPSMVAVLVVGNPPGSTLSRYPSLRFVQSTWAGVDRLVAGAPPVPVARMVAPALAELMTEFVLAAVLAVHRRFPAYWRAQDARRWRPLSIRPVRETRVGVLGFGELGAPAARALSDLGFQVAAWARSARPGPVPVLAGSAGLQRVLGSSDIVVNLLPLTQDTRGILGRDAFAAMPAGAALVNAARGAHVVEADLLEALDSGHLGEVLLDVFEEEPLPSDHPFWIHERITVLPHVAAPSHPEQLAAHVASNIRRYLSGERPRFLVTPG